MGAPLTRLWDKDFNLLYESDAGVSELVGELCVTVDEDGKRRAFRITAVTVLDVAAEAAEAACNATSRPIPAAPPLQIPRY